MILEKVTLIEDDALGDQRLRESSCTDRSPAKMKVKVDSFQTYDPREGDSHRAQCS